MEMERRHSEVTSQLFERSMEERVNDFKVDWMVATTVPSLCKIFSYFYYENTGPLLLKAGNMYDASISARVFTRVRSA